MWIIVKDYFTNIEEGKSYMFNNGLPQKTLNTFSVQDAIRYKRIGVMTDEEAEQALEAHRTDLKNEAQTIDKRNKLIADFNEAAEAFDRNIISGTNQSMSIDEPAKNKVIKDKKKP